MKPSREVTAEESKALSRALICFLADDLEGGRATLNPLPSDLLELAYTAGLRLGIEASNISNRQRSPVGK